MSRRKARDSGVITVDEYRALQDEADLQKRLIETATHLGYLTFHDYDPRRNEPGYPDLHIVGHRLSFMAELKTATGDLRPEQQVWLDELQRVDTWAADLIRPNDINDLEDFLREQAQKGT